MKINKKIFNRFKIITVAVSLGITTILTSCRSENKKNGQISIIPTLTSSTTTTKEVIESTTTATKQTSTSSTTTTKEVIESTTTATKQTSTSSTIKDNIFYEQSFDIKNYVFSKKEVTVYNSEFNISEDLQNKINNNIKKFGSDCSFIAVNLNDGMSFGYNVDKKYPTASTIKAAFALYCCKEMDKGNGSLDEMKLYEEKFRRDGSGILKNKKSGAEYSIKDLLYYTIDCSDNVAYYMIHDRFYNNSYNKFLKELGCNNLYLYNGYRWGQIDARSMALVWQEIYKYKDESPNGKYLFELFTNAKYNYIEEGMKNYKSAHKSGWTPTETHDSGIVFAEDDYIVVILNNNKGNCPAKTQLLKISQNIENVIDEYTIYKQKNRGNQKILRK